MFHVKHSDGRIRGLRRCGMDKEEILAKSREDNRGVDERFRILNQRQSVVINLVKVSTDTGAVGFHGFVTQLYDPADYDV